MISNPRKLFDHVLFCWKYILPCKVKLLLLLRLHESPTISLLFFFFSCGGRQLPWIEQPRSGISTSSALFLFERTLPFSKVNLLEPHESPTVSSFFVFYCWQLPSIEQPRSKSSMSFPFERALPSSKVKVLLLRPNKILTVPIFVFCCGSGQLQPIEQPSSKSSVLFPFGRALPCS